MTAKDATRPSAPRAWISTGTRDQPTRPASTAAVIKSAPNETGVQRVNHPIPDGHIRGPRDALAHEVGVSTREPGDPCRDIDGKHSRHHPRCAPVETARHSEENDVDERDSQYASAARVSRSGVIVTSRHCPGDDCPARHGSHYCGFARWTWPETANAKKHPTARATAAPTRRERGSLYRLPFEDRSRAIRPEERRRERLHAHHGSQRAQSLWRTRGRRTQDQHESHGNANSTGRI